MDQFYPVADPVRFDEILRQARAASREAEGQLLEACRARLQAFAACRFPRGLRARSSPEDLVQDTFREATEHFGAFRGSVFGQLKAWLFGILTCNISDCIRDHCSRAKRRAGRELHLDDRGESGRLHDQLVARTLSPGEGAVEHERAERLARALNELPERYRQALQLHYSEGLSFEEVGARLGCTTNSGRHYCRRARCALAAALNDSKAEG